MQPHTHRSVGPSAILSRWRCSRWPLVASRDQEQLRSRVLLGLRWGDGDNTLPTVAFFTVPPQRAGQGECMGFHLPNIAMLYTSYSHSYIPHMQKQTFKIPSSQKLKCLFIYVYTCVCARVCVFVCVFVLVSFSMFFFSNRARTESFRQSREVDV